MNITDKVIKRFHTKYIIDPITGCWNWTGARTSAGYGELGLNGKIVTAHRLSYMIFRGEIPDGFLVCHTCDKPECVNPDHLFLGTNRDNVNDMIQKGRQNLSNAPNGRRNGQSGEKNYQAKLTEPDVLEIRRLYSIGLNRKEITQLFPQVGRKNIEMIIRRATWAWLEDGLNG